MITNIDKQKCTGCGTCVKSCSLDVFTLDTDQDAIAPCMSACPCQVDVRGVIYLLQQDRIEEALQLFRESVPFPIITGLLCSRPCEQSCIRYSEGGPVNIRALEHYLGLHDTVHPAAPTEVHLGRVAVIGSGLAGLSCAYFMRNLGYPVTIYEADPAPGGWLVSALPGEVLGEQVARIKAMGIELRCNTLVGREGDIGWDTIMEHFSACCVAVGNESRYTHLKSGQMRFEASADPQTGQTQWEQIFAAGAVRGADNVAESIGQARQTARSMDRWLRGVDFQSEETGIRPILQKMPPLLPAPPRQAESQGGLDWEGAQVESLRCLTCGSKSRITHTDDCMTCFTCELSCPTHAITVHPFKEILPRTLRNIVEGL